MTEKKTFFLLLAVLILFIVRLKVKEYEHRQARFAGRGGDGARPPRPEETREQ